MATPAACPNCGAPPATHDATFCMMCGARMKPETPPAPVAAPPIPAAAPPTPPAPEAPRPWWEGRPPWHAPPAPPDLIGLLSFGMFLLIVAVVWASNPLVFSQFISWIGDIARAATLPRPPDPLIWSAALLFGLGAGSGYFTAVLRASVVRQRWRAVGDVLSATATLVFAVLLSAYANHVLSGWAVIALEVATVGFLIFLYIFVSLVRWRVWWLGAPQRAPEPPGKP